jgi:hypothetical protein
MDARLDGGDEALSMSTHGFDRALGRAIAVHCLAGLHDDEGGECVKRLGIELNGHAGAA